ncbi:hypothetical protein FC093_13780 [Ilyomonas limi]|uniref:Uncharacterized protein n=1 Tax=Ilyomonas limi TaxID=2575867 RepID=A0A4V5UU58_9BACT|nr:hypothetical protein [Ilyomonas limi]TKK67813.1 hypothetical protein FC093_13780 [Ilyomonas limi]
MLVEERREKLINTISHLPEDKLAIVEELLSKINDAKNSTIDHIYKEAVSKYNETPQKLAQ